MRPISFAIRSAVTDAVQSALQTKVRALKVYAVAERIRLGHLEENVALEDIVDLIVAQSGRGVCMEIDQNDSRLAVLGLNADDAPRYMNGSVHAF